jgi:hypothetical protein
MKPCRISRRTLLRGLGASLALPSLEIMAPAARASGGVAPVRLLSLFQPNGVYPRAWDVTDLAGGGFELSPILSPLRGLMGDFSVVSGLDTCGRGHVQMTGAFLTGLPMVGQRNGVSLDQQVARQIGHLTPLPSIELGTEPPRQGNASGEPIAYANTVSWSTETTRVSPEVNPQVAFDRLFRGHTGPEAERRAANRRSVIDLVLEDAKALRKRASGSDGRKLDEYLEAVRGVELRVEKTLSPPERDWTPPTGPGEGDLARPGPGIPGRRDEHLRLMMDLMVLAFWTDTTRVGTLMTAHGFSRQHFSFLPGVTGDHHGMSHHKNKPETIAEYTRVSTWFIEQFAYLLGRMKSIREGDGTLLDHSVVLYGCGMKDGNGHIPVDLPLLVAGRGGGRLRPGQHLTAPKGTPHSNLLLTLGQTMGLEIDQFNGVSTGTLSGLVA